MKSTLLIRHGYKRDIRGVQCKANYELLRVTEDGTVTTIGPLSAKIAEALGEVLSVGD